VRRDTRAARVLPHVRGPHVLDVGCTGHHVHPGSPRWLHGRIVERFPQAVGIDIDLENALRARRAGFHWIVVGDAERFAFLRRFDTIVAGEVIEHLANPGSFLSRARDHLAYGGRLVLTTPYPFSLFCWLYALLKFPRTCENPQHTCWLCPRTLEELARRAQLAVVHWELIEDYEPDSSAPRYRYFTRMMLRLGRLVPARLRCNAMLFVMARNDEP
jgi:SAM-dependent methyltransferase